MSDETRQSFVRLFARMRVHALHYIFALVTSSCNAGIATVVASLGLAAGAAIDPANIRPLDVGQMYAAFKYGAIINAIYHLWKNPLPEKLPAAGDTAPPFTT